jgi:hypothetical protein
MGKKLGVVVYTCNPNYTGGRGRRIIVQGPSREIT